MASPALFVDARNALYRAIYASKMSARRSGHANRYHYFVVFLRQMASWINRYKPSSMHVFWDAPRKTVWRRKALETYKDRSKSTYVEDISEDLFKTTNIAKAMLKHMGVRQYERAEMEADDLIYAATAVYHPKESVIISTDSDLVQIPFSFKSSVVFDPHKSQVMDVPNYSPVQQKALAGDKSDSIDGYRGIGPVKSKALVSDPVALQEFLTDRGRNIFHRNLLLIDLALVPGF